MYEFICLRVYACVCACVCHAIRDAKENVDTVI